MTNPTWPHTFVVPKYATMGEYKHLPPANHFHMIQGLTPARLEYWMDLNCVLSQATGLRGPRTSRASTARCPCCMRRTAAKSREADVGKEAVGITNEELEIKD
jgi:hypothetical protein